MWGNSGFETDFFSGSATTIGAAASARMQARRRSSELSERAKICALQALQVMQQSSFLESVKRAFVLAQTGQTPRPIRLSFATVFPLYSGERR